MNTIQGNKLYSAARSAALPIALMFVVAMLAGCERAEQSADSTETPAQVDQSTADATPSVDEAVPQGGERPLGDVAEFEDYTLRASVSPTELLPASMASQYGIETAPNLLLLNVVVLEKRPDQQPVPVSAELSAHYESLVGHKQDIDMRAVEADGLVSYIGTFDASAQHVFRFVIEAQPAGADQPLPLNFEVLLGTPDE
jgi:hypothetical protein